MTVKSKAISPKKKGRATQLSEKIAERLATLRSDLGLTQRGMAEKIDVTFQQYQKYEKAKDRLSLERAIVLSEQLGLPLTYFSQDAASKTGFAESGQAAFGEHQKAVLHPDEELLLKLLRQVPKKSRKDFMDMVAQTAKVLSGKN